MKRLRHIDFGMRRGQGGAALVYVLALIALLGLLIGQVLRQMGFDRHGVLRAQAGAQAGLLAESGVDYALSRTGPVFLPDRDIGIEGLDGKVDGDARAFYLRLFPWGAGVRLASQGKAIYPGVTSTRLLTADLGQRMDLAGWPTLTLVNRGGSLVQAGHSSITGTVLMWRGDVRPATESKVLFSGTGLHQGRVEDSAALGWKHLPFDFSQLRAWFAKADATPGISEELILGDEFSCRDSSLLARRITITHGSRFQNCLVTALDKMEMTGEVSVKGGQFLAGDSLYLQLDQPLQGSPLFATRGRIHAEGKDTLFSGALVVKRLIGEALVIAAALDKPPYDSHVDLVLGSQVNMEGLAITRGYADIRGRLRGGLVCENLQFEKEGTVFLGHLLDARLDAMDSRKMIDLPLILPRWPVVARNRQWNRE